MATSPAAVFPEDELPIIFVESELLLVEKQKAV
jgi:hypothetical protein